MQIAIAIVSVLLVIGYALTQIHYDVVVEPDQGPIDLGADIARAAEPLTDAVQGAVDSLGRAVRDTARDAVNSVAEPIGQGATIALLAVLAFIVINGRR